MHEWFQFLIVRLKCRCVGSWALISVVSIPYSTIKIGLWKRLRKENFVSIPYSTIKMKSSITAKRLSHVSIPYSTIKIKRETYEICYLLVSIPYSTIKISFWAFHISHSCVSIPYSTIKMNKGKTTWKDGKWFQFLIVRLKSSFAKFRSKTFTCFNSL